MRSAPNEPFAATSAIFANSFGLKKPQGALVSAVEKGSPAEKTGLEPGDVIVRLGERQISHSADLPALVADLKPGAAVKLEIVRKDDRANPDLECCRADQCEREVAVRDR